MKVTLWYRKIKGNEYEFNHIENDWNNRMLPTAKFPEQESWKNQRWSKEQAFLEKGKIVHVPTFNLNVYQLRDLIDDVWKFCTESEEVPGHQSISDPLLEPYIGKFKAPYYRADA